MNSPALSPAVARFEENTADFSPEASGLQNTRALQALLDRGGRILINRPGVYRVAGTAYIGSDTELIFAPGVVLRKTDEAGPFSHVLLNRGARDRRTDRRIRVEGLHLEVNGVDKRVYEVFGLHGQLAFFHVEDVRIERFRCHDLGAWQYAIQVCSFENLLVNDVVIHGRKDGVHLGRGRRFRISNGVFRTYDDAVALNAHDYSTGNPELGWIEDGIVENCHDLEAPDTTGFFCRILAGAWTDWLPGMKVRQSDTVVSGGRLYRVQMQPDGREHVSTTRPTHTSGRAELDGITWGVVQEGEVRTAGVRNVTFRDIFLRKNRTAFSIHFDNDIYSRSFYPGAEIPEQGGLLFDGIRVLHDGGQPLLSIDTPVDLVALRDCFLRDNPVVFRDTGAELAHPATRFDVSGCVFPRADQTLRIENGLPNKQILLNGQPHPASSGIAPAR